MKKIFATGLATIALFSTPNVTFAAENLLQSCINWYPNRVEWCKRQYPDLVNTIDRSIMGEIDQPISQETKPSNNISADRGKGVVEAITSVSKTSSRSVLFVNVKKSGNVLCAEDGPSWILAEKDGNYYAINGLARSWVANMKVYKEGKWHAVKDGGAGPNPSFSTSQAYDWIKIGKELCPVPTENFVENLARRVRFGEEQARLLGSKYGL